MTFLRTALAHQRPFHRPACLLAAAALLLAACGGGPERPRREAGARSATDAYQEALVNKEKGDCERAIPTFERLARIGRGWELAQVNLAECLIEIGRDESGAAAQARYGEALSWLMPAAQSNESKAQVLLAEVFLEGLGTPTDRIEAGKWYVLSRKSAIEGVSDAPVPVGRRLEATLSPAEWQEARERAELWSPSYQGVNAAALLQRRRRPSGGDAETRPLPPVGDPRRQLE